jgi:hypothetical protein
VVAEVGVCADDSEANDPSGLAVESHPRGRDFAFELQLWQLHCEAWSEYRAGEDEFESYTAFLAQRGSSST